MAKSKSIITREHPHTKKVRSIASNKKSDTIGLTIILGILAGIFVSCIMIDPHSDSLKEIIVEVVKYVGGGASGGAIMGLILGEIIRREHINLHLKYHDEHQFIKSGKKRIKEKEMRQGTYLGEHTLGDNSLLKEYDEWLMRR
jgi:hypothetical protein